MTKLSPEEERQRGLTRDRLVGAALELVNEEGLHAAIKEQLESAGLQPAEAGEVALMLMVSAIAGQVPTDHAPVKAGSPASIAIDSGSRGVVLRHGAGMETLFRVAHDRKTAAP